MYRPYRARRQKVVLFKPKAHALGYDLSPLQGFGRFANRPYDDIGSPRKVVEKAKNNYFCSMETGYELFLPEGILTYFEVTHADRTATAILIYLDEKDLSEEERSGKHLQSKGFYPPASIHDFPLRGKSLILHVRRRRWVDLDTGNPYMRAWEVVAKGTRLTEEFASFLKGTPG